jgi:hypothetical protein
LRRELQFRDGYDEAGMRICGNWRGAVVIVLGCALLGVGESGFTQDTKRDGNVQTQGQPAFAAADAVRVLDGLRRAFESGRQGRFLKAFDGRRMPGYAEFRDQMAEFFDRCDSFRMRYRVTQTAMDGEFGAVVAEVGIDAVPADGTGPGVRRDASVRLVLAWDGKGWKIIDLAPRNLFR